MTPSNGNIFRVTGPLCGEFTGHRWIPLTKTSDTELWCFYLICAWINGWVNNSEAGDLRRHHAHSDVTVGLMVFTGAFFLGATGEANMLVPCYLVKVSAAHLISSTVSNLQIDGLVQERRNPSAFEMELHLSCFNPLKWVYGFKPFCEISKGIFEISHKILSRYTAKSAFYCLVFLRVSYDMFELWRHMP